MHHVTFLEDSNHTWERTTLKLSFLDNEKYNSCRLSSTGVLNDSSFRKRTNTWKAKWTLPCIALEVVLWLIGLMKVISSVDVRFRMFPVHCGNINLLITVQFSVFRITVRYGTTRQWWRVTHIFLCNSKCNPHIHFKFGTLITKSAFTLYATRRDATRRDATRRDATRYDATFKYCSHYARHRRAPSRGSRGFGIRSK